MMRAPLFVPASRPELFAKAAASGADGIILDLEDGVAPEQRAAARAALHTDFTELPVVVRINAVGTEWHDADLAALAAKRIATIMLPKAETPAQIRAVARAHDRSLRVIALIETAAGLAAARALAACPDLCGLAFGSLDFCADMGMSHTREALLPARSELVLAAQLAGIAPPLDGVTAQISRPEEAATDAAHARAMGMGGKLCIHPSQVAPVRQAFLPSAQELDKARRILATGEGAVSLDGNMVDEPVRRRARSLIAEAEAASTCANRQS